MNKLLALLALVVLPTWAALPLPQVPLLEMAPVDVEAALRADAGKAAPQPYRFAVPIPVAITPLTHGRWETLADGRQMWRVRIRSAGATSLNFGFTQWLMPEGAALRVYAPEGADLRGPYTAANNNAARQLWTPIVRGDEAVIELVVPSRLRAATTLLLGRVNHGFRGFGAKAQGQAKSGSCNIDVACPDAAGWDDEIRSVARYTVAGALLCTGQLVNNTAQDFTPYFLSAAHCLSGAAAATTVYYFNYETSTCGGTPDGALDQTVIGAAMVATSGTSTAAGSDFVLLRLLQAPPASYGVHYAGWDRRDVAPRGVTGIHHPSGDEKRISFDFDPLTITAYLEDGGTGVTHLRVGDWDRGVTEGGSSGSGIWNSDHRLVGTLSGGYSSCEAPNDPDWYGRFHQHWSAGFTPLNSVATWLDPGGSGAEFLSGADPGSPTTSPPPSSGGISGPGGDGGGAISPLAALMLLGFSLRRRLRRR